MCQWVLVSILFPKNQPLNRRRRRRRGGNTFIDGSLIQHWWHDLWSWFLFCQLNEESNSWLYVCEVQLHRHVVHLHGKRMVLIRSEDEIHVFASLHHMRTGEAKTRHRYIPPDVFLGNKTFILRLRLRFARLQTSTSIFLLSTPTAWSFKLSPVDLDWGVHSSKICTTDSGIEVF